MPRYTDYVPTLNSATNAVMLMRYGAGAAGLSAVLTAGIGIEAIYKGHPVLGMDEWCLVDAAVFAVIAWRVACRSLPWAIVGLLVFVFEEITKLVNHPNPRAIIGVVSAAVVWGPCYVHAVRGGLYLRSTKPVSEPEKVEHSAFKQEQPGGHKHEEHSGYMPAPVPAPEAAHDDYNEFLQYLRGKGRRFQKPGRSIQDEFKAWSAHRATHRPAGQTKSKPA